MIDAAITSVDANLVLHSPVFLLACDGSEHLAHAQGRRRRYEDAMPFIAATSLGMSLAVPVLVLILADPTPVPRDVVPFKCFERRPFKRRNGLVRFRASLGTNDVANGL